MPTLQDSLKGEQLSNEAIKERLRPAAGRAVLRMIELMESTNENVALGASKEILGRFVPLLRSVELSTGDNSPLLVWDIDAIKKFVSQPSQLPTKTE